MDSADQCFEQRLEPDGPDRPDSSTQSGRSGRRRSAYVKGRRVRLAAAPGESRNTSDISRQSQTGQSMDVAETVLDGAMVVPLNVIDFSEDSLGQNCAITKRGSIHGEGTRVTCNVHELVRSSTACVELDQGEPCQVSGETVLLNIYDLGDNKAIRKLNVVMKPFGGGAFHAAVQVFDQEWSFGGLGSADEDGEESGIWSCSPQKCRQHTFRETVVLGTTSLSHLEVLRILCNISPAWPMNSYDLLRRNCCHFCDEFCRLLGVGPLPDWVLNLANVGAALDDGFSNVACKVRSAMSTANKLKLDVFRPAPR